MPRIVFAGCGFLGEAAALLFKKAGWDVVGLTYHEKSARALRVGGISADVVDLTSADSVHAMALRLKPVDVIIHTASSGGGSQDTYRAVYRDGMKHLAAAFPDTSLIFTGSTSVYGQVHGETVTETSLAEPGRTTGRILLEAENIAISSGGAVARLGGIYGPGRSVLLRKFFDGTARIEGDGSRMLNQIHRDDAASALLCIANIRARGVFNVVDDSPAPQREIYQWIADACGGTLPRSVEPDLNRKRGWTSKRVSNAQMRALGWTPCYASFRDALPELILEYRNEQ